jgi:hypothetical protein
MHPASILDSSSTVVVHSFSETDKVTYRGHTDNGESAEMRSFRFVSISFFIILTRRIYLD